MDLNILNQIIQDPNVQALYQTVDDLPISIYGILLIVYLVTQIYYAVREKIRQSSLKEYEPETWPFVTSLVPFYNESFQEIDDTIVSLLEMEYPKERHQIIVMDDGSDDESVYHRLFEKYNSNKNIRVLRQKNGGKRDAQANMSHYSHSNVEYYLTVDSDTTFDPMALKEMVKVAKFFDVEAVSGGIMVKRDERFLNLLLRVRYWIANWQERLSQSWFNQVNCCSGPCSLWKASMYHEVREAYVNQTFLGKKCTYGDDRHLTNLFILKGAKIKMADKAFCYTSVPETWKKWVKQQVRWSKSFYRESFWSFTRLGEKMGWFFKYQNSMAFILPFVLVFNIFYYSITGNVTPRAILFYLVSIMLAGLARGLYGFLSTFDKTYFLAPVYGFVHFVIVFPIRVYALFRMRDTKWGTR